MRAVGLVQAVSRPALPQAVCLVLRVSQVPERPMVLPEAWRLALAQHLEAEPRVQAVAAQSEQPLALVVPSELRPVAEAAVPVVLELHFRVEQKLQ